MIRWYKSLTITQLIWYSVACLGALVAANFYYVHHNTVEQESFYRISDLAGKTRMLSQMVAKEARQTQIGNLAARPRMQEAINLHDFYLGLLISGGQDVESGSEPIPAAAPTAHYKAGYRTLGQVPRAQYGGI